MGHENRHWIVDDSLEQLSTLYRLFKDLGSAWVFVVIQIFCEETARLPRKHLNIVVNETLPHVCRSQMGIFFCGGHTNIPHLFPRFIELFVDWIYARMVRSHRILIANWNVIIQGKLPEKKDLNYT
jgi:hypothetical protein